jgi:hypothetical protein
MGNFTEFRVYMAKTQSDSLIKVILRLPQTTLSMREILLFAKDATPSQIYERINYYVKKGYLYQIRRGLYTKNKSYDPLEVASKLMTPSYISFETVLIRAGVIFQYYDRIFSASYRTRTIICDKQTYAYKRIKYSILTNTQGIQVGNLYSIATAERAFLDTVYLSQSYYFDHLAALDWQKVYQLLPLYENKRMEKSIQRYQEQMKKKREHATEQINS